MLPIGWKRNSGLVMASSEKYGCTDWVLEKHVERFKQEGKSLYSFGADQLKSEAQESAQSGRKFDAAANVHRHASNDLRTGELNGSYPDEPDPNALGNQVAIV